MTIKQKLLKEFEYKKYKVEILGEFTIDYGTEYKGKYYGGAIVPQLIISKEGKVHLNMNFYKLSDAYLHQYTQSELLGSFKCEYEDTFWSKIFKTKGKVIKLIHIKDDYERFINVIITIAKEKVDTLSKQYDLEEFEQNITDGIPDSLKELHPDILEK